MAGRVLLYPLAHCNPDVSGRYRIQGTADRLGVVGSYQIVLFNALNQRVLAETWSAADGTYTFDYLAYRANGYFVIAHDRHTGSPLNAAIADLITPEPMP